MIKFTNFRTKALALVAMTAFSAGSVFGQRGGNDRPSDEPNFPPINSTSSSVIRTTPKILQWSNQTNLQAPVANGKIVQGVTTSFSDAGNGNRWNEIDVNQLQPSSSELRATNNPTQTSWWIDNNSLYMFAGETNRMAVTFDFSTKYLNDVKNLEISLGSDRLGGANMDVDFDLRIEVRNLNGELVDYDDIYSNADDDNDFIDTYTHIYNTADGNKVLKFFQPATDEAEDHPFRAGSLDNKLIRITLVSDLPEGDPGDHFPAALVVKSVTLSSQTPVLSLSASALGLFEAGMNYITPWTNTLTLSQAGLDLTGTPMVKLTSPVGFKLKDGSSAKSSLDKQLGSNPVKAQYAFNPEKIDVFNGNFKAAANFVFGPNDILSPIQTLTAETANLTGSSVPELHLNKSKLTFVENWASEDIKIWGKNIPKDNKADLVYEGGFMDDQDDSAEAAAGVENHFTIGDLGVIDDNSSNYLRVHFAQFLNNVDVNVAKYLKISKKYGISKAIRGTGYFNGRQNDSFVNPNATLAKFPQVLVVGNVAAVWFEYEGTEGTPAQMVGDISTAFYAPYDETLLPEQQAVSRTKAFYLKGAKVKPDASNVAKFEISLDKLAQHDNDGHMAFRYSVDNGANWNTPAVKKVISVSLNTQQEIEDFQTKGVKILVQFKPDCDGFETANYSDLKHASDFYKWNPHHNVLQAKQVEGGSYQVQAGAIVFGDTRANLENTIHDWNFVDVMQNSIQKKWNTVLTKSEFRKDYGNTYLGACGEQNNPLSEGVFYVTGYNLTKNVKIAEFIDANYKDSKKAFFITIEPEEGFGTVNGMEIEPNDFGEVAAKVIVNFEPSDKVAGIRAVNELITVKYDGRTIEDGNRWWDPEFNYAELLKERKADNSFAYPKYDYPQATLCGRVYEPTFNKVNVVDMESAIDTEVSQKFTFTATDLDKSKGKVTIALVKGANSPFTISPVEFTINDNGEASGEVTLKFKPTTNSIENCEFAVDAMTYSYGDCSNADLAFSGVEGITVVAQPTFGAFQAGDIQGDRVDLRVTPAKGGDNYVVGIGVLKYSKKTSSIFMSEVYAKDNVTYVELFNGTGEALNPDIISEGSPNYYMEVYEGATKKQTIILGAADAALWKPYGITVKTINYDLASDKEYTLVLKQGQITLDVYKFTGDVTHKTRKDNLDPAAYYKVSVFNEADWTTVGGWHTSLNATTQTPLYASMFHAEVPAADFKQYFDDVTVERAQYGFQTGLSVNKLKKGVTYTAYAYTEPSCDGVKVTEHPAYKNVAASDSELVDGDPMKDVTFGYFTGIDQVEVAKNIYAVNGKIYVVGATEAVTIFNALGMQVKAASIEEAAAGIDVANGIYMVKSGSKTAKVLVNR